MKFICPVCGFPELMEKPRGSETGGSYEICPSCGFQFGVSDDDEGFTFLGWRQAWIEAGAKWQSVARPPPSEWNPHLQLKRLAYPPLE